MEIDVPNIQHHFLGKVCMPKSFNRHCQSNYFNYVPKCSLWPQCNFNIIFNPAQRWKYTYDKKLINNYHESVGSYLDKYWTLPEENAEGYIEASDEVLGVVNFTDPQSYVELVTKITPISEGQKWYRGTTSKNGWFTLTNPYSGKVLRNFYGYYTIIDGNWLINHYYLHTVNDALFLFWVCIGYKNERVPLSISCLFSIQCLYLL